MKKQLSKVSFLLLSFVVISVNAYAQATHNRSLKIEGTRQIIAGARRSASGESILDDILAIFITLNSPLGQRH
jgi:hypothetical protein